MKLTRVSFPPDQRIAKTTDLMLAVENTGEEDDPAARGHDLDDDARLCGREAAGSFNVQTGTSARPVWVPDGFPKPGRAAREPGGTEAAQTDTYIFGALPAGRSRTVAWRVTPVRAGDYTLHYAVAAGLAGQAKAVDASGDPAGGELAVTIE